MAVVTELVTEFKFEGDTKALKEAGDQMNRVSENSGIAEKRMEGANTSFVMMGKGALGAIAGVTALALSLQKIASQIYDIGKESGSLRGLGIDSERIRGMENLFTELGTASEDATNLYTQIRTAQSELSLGRTPQFLTDLQNSFGISFGEDESVQSILNRMRARAQADPRRFSIENISNLGGELGFSNEFHKVLLATETEFKKATIASEKYAKVTNEQLKATENLSDEWDRLALKSKRLTDQAIIPLTEAIIPVIKYFGDLVGGDYKVKEFREGTGLGMQNSPLLREREDPLEKLNIFGMGSLNRLAPSSPSQLRSTQNNTVINFNSKTENPKAVANEMQKFLDRTNQKNNNRVRGSY